MLLLFWLLVFKYVCVMDENETTLDYEFACGGTDCYISAIVCYYICWHVFAHMCYRLEYVDTMNNTVTISEI